MKILLYHFGYYGDILVVGQNFTRELMLRYPGARIDLMLRPRMQKALDVLEPLGLFHNILFGEKKDYQIRKVEYDLAFMIDEKIYPEGQLRTIFTQSGWPYRQHPLTIVTTAEDEILVRSIVKQLKRPIIATQNDMSRKWPREKVNDLWERLSRIGSLAISGPDYIFPGSSRPLTFRESAALFRQADIFVGIDSGLSHAAALAGTQTVLIPCVWPNSWISPIEYANPFIHDENLKHIDLRPPHGEFCGHYLCLRTTGKGAIARYCGDPIHVKCSWKKIWGVKKKKCCFQKISVDDFYNVVATTLKKRGLI